MKETTLPKKGRVAGIIVTIIAAIMLLTLQGWFTKNIGFQFPPVIIQVIIFIAAGVVIAMFVHDTYTYTYCIVDKVLHVYRSVGRWDSPICSIDRSNFISLVKGKDCAAAIKTANVVCVNRCYSIPDEEKKVVLFYKTGFGTKKAGLVITPSKEMFQNICEILLDNTD